MRLAKVFIGAGIVIALVLSLALAIHILPFAHAASGAKGPKCPTNTGATFWPSGKPVPTSTECSMIYPPQIIPRTPPLTPQP